MNQNIFNQSFEQHQQYIQISDTLQKSGSSSDSEGKFVGYDDLNNILNTNLGRGNYLCGTFFFSQNIYHERHKLLNYSVHIAQPYVHMLHQLKYTTCTPDQDER